MFPALRTAVGVLVLIAASNASAQSAMPPQTFTPEGGAALPLAGQATRGYLLGSIDIYNVALYVEGPAVDDARLGAEGTSKALRIEIRYQDDLRRRVSIDWRGELVPSLETPATAHLRATFGSLKQGDVLAVEYVPEKGTAVRINKIVAAAGANHDLMLAFLDHWLGQRPVSEDIKRKLLGSS